MSTDTPAEQASPFERLTRGENLSAPELRALRNRMPATSREQRDQINKALAVFEQKNAATIGTDKETQDALLDLRQSLAAADAPASALPAASNNTGETPEPPRATTIIYNRWKEMMDPNHSVQGRLLRAAGFVAAGYGIYRLATWITGRPKNTFMWKAVKYTGLAALAAWTIGVLTHNKEVQPGQASKKEEKKPEVAEPAPAGKEAKTALDAFPANVNLVDGKAYNVPVDGKIYNVQFMKNAIMINNQKFTLAAKGASPFGGDVNLNLLNARITNRKLSVTAGAFGQSGGTEWSEAELKGLLSELRTKGSSEQVSTDAKGNKTTVLIKSATK